MEVIEVDLRKKKKPIDDDWEVESLLEDINSGFYTNWFRNACIKRYNELTGENLPYLE